MKTCQNPECGQEFESNNPDKKFCSDKCRTRAWRSKSQTPTTTTMNGIEDNGGFKIHNQTMNPFGNEIQRMVYQDKINQLAHTSAECKSLKKMVEDLRNEKAELKGEIKDLNHSFNSEKRDIKDQFEARIRELETEIKELTRDLEAAEKGNGLNGIFNKAIEKENGLVELAQAGSMMIESLAKMKNSVPQTSSLNPDSDEAILLDWYSKLTPPFKESFDQLIGLIVNKGMEGTAFINQILNHYGTIEPQKPAATQ